MYVHINKSSYVNNNAMYILCCTLHELISSNLEISVDDIRQSQILKHTCSIVMAKGNMCSVKKQSFRLKFRSMN